MKNEKRPEVVVVTGGEAGVGRATVRQFAINGARIGLIARSCERLGRAKQELETIGVPVTAFAADVSSAEQVEYAAQEIERTLGPIDVWVNNAMVSVFSPFKQMTAEEFKRVTEVTYLGYVYGTMAALKRMIPRNHGTVVQVGSALAYRSIPLQSAYCGAKHAIIGFTDSIRTELLHDKSSVHITMVHLPAMNTPQFDWVRSNLTNRAKPVPPIYQPEVAADAIVWAAHQKRRQVLVGWPTVRAAWGQKVAPGLLDKYLARTSYQAQQTPEPENPTRFDNLYEPVPGDYEAHGRFDRRARKTSPELWLTKHRSQFAWGLLIAGMTGVIGSMISGKNDQARAEKKAVRSVEQPQEYMKKAA